MTTEELREALMRNPKNGYSRITAEERQNTFTQMMELALKTAKALG